MSDFEATVRALARKYALENAVKHGGKATPGGVIGKIMAEAPDLRGRGKEIPPIAAGVIEEVNAMTPDARKAAFDAVAGTIQSRTKAAPEHPLKALPNAVHGKVVMRFAPNPSGPATFGHARGMVINWSYRQRYEGKLILRFDDTDATVKRPMLEAYDWIPEDFEWLCGKPDLVIAASSRMDLYYEAALEAIRAGGAYVCECEAEAFRTLKNAGEPCPHRGQEEDVNLDKWGGMLAGRYRPGEATLRVKTDIRHKDPALRDWVGFRLARDVHPLVGDKYRVWPLLDFQSAVDDHDTGVTHIIRGKDLMDSTRKQTFLYRHLGWTYPETLYWGRVSVHEFGKFSKSILTDAIRRGEYTGWDDPRLPTLRALRRRGFTKEGITNFWLGLGLSEKDIAASLLTVEAENKKVLEPLANRYFWVERGAPLRLEGADRLVAEAPLHPEHPGRGVRRIALEPPLDVVVPPEDLRGACETSEGKMRLKDLANVRVRPEAALTALEGSAPGPVPATHEGNDLAWVKATRAPIVQWVSRREGVRCVVVSPENERLEGLAEPDLAHEPVGAHVQLERVGFARVDGREPDGTLVLWFTHK